MVEPITVMVDADARIARVGLAGIGGVVGGVSLCVLAALVVAQRVRECLKRSLW